ncbi:MAG: hypothetical protein WKG00_25805 [Polyangiaceae bacterium]
MLALGATTLASMASMAACASDGDDDRATSESASSSASASTGAGATGGSGGGEGGAGASGGAGGAAGSGGAGGAGDAGGGGGGPQGSVVPTIDGYDFFVNCQPAVPPDPINGSFTASYDNQDAVDGLATITKVLLELDDGVMATDWELDVSPADSNIVPAGATVTVTHTKVQGSGSGTIPPCEYCGGGRGNTWKLKVTWDVAGTMVTEVSEASPVMCAF